MELIILIILFVLIVVILVFGIKGALSDKKEASDKNLSQNGDISKRSRTAALLFTIFLGGVGAHRYYLGDKTAGIRFSGGFAVSAVAYSIGYSQFISDVMRLSTSSRTPEVNTLMMLGSVGFLIVGVFALVDLVKIISGKMQDADGSIVSTW